MTATFFFHRIYKYSLKLALWWAKGREIKGILINLIWARGQSQLKSS
jgi:hypothetical protein